MLETEAVGTCLVQKLKWGVMAPCPLTSPSGNAPVIQRINSRSDKRLSLIAQKWQIYRNLLATDFLQTDFLAMD